MESTLALQLSDLAAQVGRYLGYATLPTGWTGWQAASPYVPDPSLPESDLAQIMVCIQKGLRCFYNAKTIVGGPPAHKWSFLTQLRTLTTAAGQTTYLLPDDYGGADGEWTFPASQGVYRPIRRTGIGEVQRMLSAQLGVSMFPQAVAIYLTPAQGTTGQRYQACFAPVPDQAYTLTYLARVLPQMLTAQAPWPLGGEQHAETILAACLAQAESFLNDERTNHQAEFAERLEASISQDVQENCPKTLGQMRERSDAQEAGYGGDRYGLFPFGTNEVLYNGQSFSSF